MGKVEMIVDSRSMRILLEEIEEYFRKMNFGERDKELKDALTEVSRAYVKGIPYKGLGEELKRWKSRKE